MDTKINHIKNLVHFAFVDNNLHDNEKAFIIKVGERLGLEKSIVDYEINNKSTSAPQLPSNEILRFMLLDDILNLILADNEISEEEIKECQKVATEFGFDIEIINSLVDKLKKHIENGFIENQTSHFIKNELFNLTTKNFTDAKYN